MTTRPIRRAGLKLAALLTAFGLALLPARAGDGPVIAAASSVQSAVTEIAAAFTAETGQAVRLSFGSTGNFARQIREGAPYAVFLAADEDFILGLYHDGIVASAGDPYAEGRLVIIVPKGGALAADPSLDGLAAALDAGQIDRFAIANPDHAPYGLRDRITPLLVIGENVAQAAQFAVSGNAEGGIIAYSLALAPEVAARSDHALIPADWHAPLRQRMVLLDAADPVAVAFYAYMQGAAAGAILARHGLALPGEG
jgi:molybdate transport system substrate-binding protein